MSEILLCALRAPLPLFAAHPSAAAASAWMQLLCLRVLSSVARKMNRNAGPQLIGKAVVELAATRATLAKLDPQPSAFRRTWRSVSVAFVPPGERAARSARTALATRSEWLHCQLALSAACLFIARSFGLCFARDLASEASASTLCQARAGKLLAIGAIGAAAAATAFKAPIVWRPNGMEQWRPYRWCSLGAPQCGQSSAASARKIF